jgi:integrase
VSSIEKRVRDGQTTWRAHYRTPDGRQRNKTFARKGDAERFLTTVESAKLTGSFADPALARLTVGEWSARWLADQTHLKPSTLERYAGILREHVEPQWGRVRLADVSHADVQSWIARLAADRSPATVRKVHRVLSLVLALAVKDGRLARNAAAGVSLPRVVREERQYLTHTEVERLAEACAAAPGEPVSKHRRLSERRHEDYRLIVLFLAYTGVRFGELAALRVGRLDLRRRRAVISESVTLVGSRQVFGTPKSHERREVPIPPFLVEELTAHVTGRGPDDLVFPGVRSGGPLRAPVFRRAAFAAAAASIGRPGLHPHELRHTAASLAIASGADVKVVQQMLGHASAAMTLDQYGHLFGDRLDEVAERMAAAREAAVARLLPEAEIIDLDDARRSGVSPLRPGTFGSAPGRIRTCAPASGGRCSIP